MSNFNTLDEVLQPKNGDFTLIRQDGVDVKIERSNTFADIQEIIEGEVTYKNISPNTLKGLLQDKSLYNFVNGSEYQSSVGYEVGFIVRASDGNQYYCNKNNTPLSPVNPVGDNTDTWRQYPFKKVVNANGTAYLWFNGYARTIIDIITANSGDQPNGSKLFNLPITFTKIRAVNPMPTYGNVTSDAVGYVGYHSESQVRTFVRVFENPTQSVRYGDSNEICVFGAEVVGDWV